MLEVRGLEVRYGAVQALRGVSLDVRQGEIVSLIGTNGAGKSSTLMAISGIARASVNPSANAASRSSRSLRT